VKHTGRKADQSTPSNSAAKILDLYLHSPTRLHGVVRNYLSRGTILPLLIYLLTYCVSDLLSYLQSQQVSFLGNIQLINQSIIQLLLSRLGKSVSCGVSQSL
jgi:hypothetical protein